MKKQDTIAIKDQEQRKALNLWASKGYMGSIIAGTGFGKSRCGVLAVGKLLKENEKALVLVPTTQLQDQFKEEFIKWGYEDTLPQVDIICYQTAYKLEGEHYHIVVCDEIHLGISPEYRKFFENNTYDKLLCMTATTPEEDEYRTYLTNLAPTRYKITLDECVALGLVADYKIICIPISLTEEEQKAYKKANNLFVHSKYKLGQFDAFNQAKLILANKVQGDKGAAAMFYKAIRDRKSVVQHTISKIEKSKELLKEHKKDKVLIFSGTNAFTDKMAEEVNGLSYHSKKSKKQREQILDDFRSTKSKVLCSTKALNQGFNVPDASVGIIAGLDSKALPMIQRVGRLLRLNKNKVGVIYILYVKDSQEEKWLKNAIKSLNNITWR
jgi:superfamily II DNA or RNA helicase